MSEKQEMTAKLLAKKFTALFFSIMDIDRTVRNVDNIMDDMEALIEISSATEQMFFNKYKDMLVKFRDNLCKVRTNLRKLEEKYSVHLKE